MNKLILSLLALILPAAAFAGPGKTGAAFLKIGIGARPLGMGSAFTAVANDVNAIAWNPGGLVQLSQKEISATHTRLFADTNLDFLGYACPTGFGTFGMSAVYLTQGEIEGRGENREKTASFEASDIAFAVSAARRLTGSVGLGANFKIIQQKIEQEKAVGFALDLGGIYKTRIPNLNLGLSVQNIGPSMRFIEQSYSLPLSLSIGAGYSLFGGMTLALDLKHQLYSSQTSISLGTEYLAMQGALALRAGYLSQIAQGTDLVKQLRGTGSSRIGSFTGLGAGLGIKVFKLALDYSFIPFGELGNVQRLTFGARF